MTALSVQVGGNHYKNSAVQPMQFTMINGYDSCAHTILKYVSRHRSKGGKADLEKAAHTVDLRVELVQPIWKLRAFSVMNGALVAPLGVQLDALDDPRISIETYCEANRLPLTETLILKTLDSWVRSQENDQTKYVVRIKKAITLLINEAYGEAA
jgi:hypothetical protein